MPKISLSTPKHNTEKLDKKTRIFFIDDEPAFLKMYGTKFSQEGFEVGVCEESSRALVQIKSFKPDLIFLDLVMDTCDGIKVLKQLKSNQETKWIPVVMLTNIDNLRDREECTQNGASHYLVKVNFTPHELVEYVQELSKQL